MIGSNIEQNNIMLLGELTNIMKSSDRKMNKKISTFVTKLLNIMQDETNHYCINWASHDTFVILDSNSLSKNVLPKYFKHNNLSSFIRQLNIYGFQKIKTEEDQQNQHFYRHEHFVKDNKRKLRLVQRKPHKLLQPQARDEHLNKNSKAQSQLNSEIDELRSENKKIVKQNKDLQQSILQLEKENKKQMQNILYFLSLFVSHFKQQRDLNEQNSTSASLKHPTALQRIKKQIKILNKNQVLKRNINFQNILKSLLEESRQLQSIIPKGGEKQEESIIKPNIEQECVVESDETSKICEQEEQQFNLNSSEDNGNLESSNFLNIDNMF